ncbi:hypothetical protein SLEP1_g50117 [Rubroshorea leprosula]|uniref:PHD-type domain-containing protein n=1 Tax=Rubroshorea leprosula TaxID=152421 RepID=A0AAV5M223_9ROSI|nr:hypothetical protein SLEP1_g50117 [Rubroshorea leprosula]
MRSGAHSGIVVKNRNSSGCLIVKKKGDESGGVRSSGTGKVYGSKKEKKRPRKVASDSGSSDEFSMPPRRRVGSETIQVCNSLAVYGKGIVDEIETGRKRTRKEHIRRNKGGFIGRSDSGSSDELLMPPRGRVGSETGRKRTRKEHIRQNEDGFIGRNGVDCSESKRNRLDVFEFDEYDGVDEAVFIRKKNCDYSGDEAGNKMLFGSRPTGRSSIQRDYESGSSRHIFHENKKKSFFDKSNSLTHVGRDDRSRFGMDMDDNRLPPSSLRERLMSDSDEPIRVQGKNGVLKVMVNKKKKVGEPVKNFDHLEPEEAGRGLKIGRKLQVHPSFFLEKEVLEKPGSRTMKKQMKALKLPPTKKSKGSDLDSESEDSDSSLKLTPNNMEASNSTKRVSSKEEKAQVEQLLRARIKEGKGRRGCGTEKQQLRERIRGMLLDAGWTIDYRPRRNRDYQDAVYVNPTGTAYWSIIKAYDALQKQLNDEEDEGKYGDASVFTPLPDEVLGQLTRKTKKKKEREMKRKQRDGTSAENSKQAASRRSSSMRNEEDSSDSLSHEEKLSSFLKQGKSFKNRTNENGASSASSKSQNSILHLHDSTERPPTTSNPRLVQGRKSRKFSRCTLLVRSSNQEQSAENDGFVPYSGKRTVLSWLIESGTVESSQKVKYMNRRCTRVMLQGWITRDGIHCGCCSKILTVSKFEIHAGSKLRQPFQNIYLESGSSLLQCQMDAWDRQEGSERIAFHSVDTDGDDPNDDTCGICGDGGDLICCDGCPSTFHQSCLNIEFLPPGDWHCPNCTCKFCGLGSNISEGDDATDHKLLPCNMCEKKYHKSCTKETDALPVDSNSLILSFCGNNCRELFEHLQKYLGVKHELEAGFSWSLIHRTNGDPDASLQGLPQRVECNSKLAVALTVMDECFLPIIDRRSGINLIHNVLYNSGSNFNRLNYCGFYTAILERGDEIVSAASIRFHGTQLAEMPFIGTRHIYRRQGMARRLFCAIESALRSLKVEKLVIPAIAELTHTWTTIFGFTPVEESIKQEMRSLNMLVFPGIDMLQKLFLEQEKTEGTMSPITGAEPAEIKCQITPKVADKSENDSSVRHDSPQHTDSGLQQTNMISSEVAVADSDSQFPNVPRNDASRITDSLDSFSLEPNCTVSGEETGCANSPEGDKKDESSPDQNYNSIPDTSPSTLEMDSKTVWGSSAENNTQSCIEGHIDDKPGLESPVEGGALSSKEGDMVANFGVGIKVAASSDEFKIKVAVDEKSSAYSEENQAPPCEECDVNDAHAVREDLAAFSENDIPVSVEGTTRAQSCKESDMSDAHAVDEDVNNDLAIHARSCKESAENDAHTAHDIVAASNEIEIPVSVEGTMLADAVAGDKLDGFTSDRKSPVSSYASYDKVEMENKPVSDSPIAHCSPSCEEDHSLTETFPESKVEENNEIPDMLISNGPDVSSIHVDSSNNQLNC